ncbi:Hypothetical protein A7982_09094 [Minicystis rosea]|nr:Hypothetical protein A7982_09094 [Minicystis rosea]
MHRARARRDISLRNLEQHTHRSSIPRQTLQRLYRVLKLAIIDVHASPHCLSKQMCLGPSSGDAIGPARYRS